MSDFAAQWAAMSDEEKTVLVRASDERHHKSQYDSVRELYPGRNLPEWEDLSEEERERIRGVNKAHAKEMQDFGQAIREGRSVKGFFET